MIPNWEGWWPNTGLSQEPVEVFWRGEGKIRLLHPQTISVTIMSFSNCKGYFARLQRISSGISELLPVGNMPLSPLIRFLNPLSPCYFLLIRFCLQWQMSLVLHFQQAPAGAIWAVRRLDGCKGKAHTSIGLAHNPARLKGENFHQH